MTSAHPLILCEKGCLIVSALIHPKVFNQVEVRPVNFFHTKYKQEVATPKLFEIAGNLQE